MLKILIIISACWILINNVYAKDSLTEQGIIVKSAIKHDTSLPLRFIYRQTNHFLDVKLTSKPKWTTNLAPIPLKGWQGLGVGLNDYQVNFSKPDPASSVGLIQFVQAVNAELAVFSKATGELSNGFPMPLNALWAGFGGACESQNLGGATVKYDQLTRQWLISKHAYDDATHGPFYQCIAISTGEDATDRYHRYVFQFDRLNQNTRIGLWPNAYYLATDLQGPIYNEPMMCALDRTSMISGLPATMQCKLGLPQSAPIQPVDLDGRFLPISPAGFFASLSPPNNIVFYRFNVDFLNPANTTVMNFNVAVTPFQPACPQTRGKNCAIQPFTTNRLDVDSDRVMSRFVYRQLDEYGAMLLTHIVQGPAPKHAPAVRWYEMRVPVNNPDVNPIVFQQATITPDSKNRFISSIAMDRFANIAIGYTVTSSLIFPSLELSMHNFPDPRHSTTIQPLVTSRGSQIADVHEWGSSSSMSVDPLDECTFWFTGAYLKSTGSFNWSTFILRFKLIACT